MTYRDNAKPPDDESVRTNVAVTLAAGHAAKMARAYLLSLGWDPRKTPDDLRVDLRNDGTVVICYVVFGAP